MCLEELEELSGRRFPVRKQEYCWEWVKARLEGFEGGCLVVMIALVTGQIFSVEGLEEAEVSRSF